MFFGPAALNIIRNFIFKLWIEEKHPCAHFGIHKRSPKRSPWSSEVKNTPKNWRKFELHLFQSTLNCHSEAPFWAPIFTYLKSTECPLSLEQKIIVVSFLEIFLAPCEYECCEKSIFGAPEPHSGLQNWKCPITFLKICVRALQSGIKIWVFIESSWFLIPDIIQDLFNHIFEKYSERSPKRSHPMFSNFEIFKNWNLKNYKIHFHFWKSQNLKISGGSVLGSVLNIFRKWVWVGLEYYRESKINLIR